MPQAERGLPGNDPVVRSSRMSQSQLTAWLFGLVIVAFSVALLITESLVRLFGTPTGSHSQLVLPTAFHFSTFLLAIGSLCLHDAVRQVRRERQRAFRRRLLLSLLAGILFVGVQGYGIRVLLAGRDDSVNPQLGVDVFVFAFVFLHILHFTVALLFLLYVTLQSQRDRYDHEYYWGVTVCAWFWHGLAVVWCAILMVFAISRIGNS